MFCSPVALIHEKQLSKQSKYEKKVIQPSIKYTAMVNIVVQRQFKDKTSKAFEGGAGTVFKLFSIGSIKLGIKQ